MNLIILKIHNPIYFFEYCTSVFNFYRSQSEDPAIFNIPMPSQKNTESNQLGVVAGPFGQMLVNKEQVSSRRGSSFSLAGTSLGAKDKL